LLAGRGSTCKNKFIELIPNSMEWETIRREIFETIFTLHYLMDYNLLLKEMSWLIRIRSSGEEGLYMPLPVQHIKQNMCVDIEIVLKQL